MLNNKFLIRHKKSIVKILKDILNFIKIIKIFCFRRNFSK